MIKDDSINLVVAEASKPYEPEHLDIEEATEEERETWRIKSKAEAAWAMEKLRWYAEQMQENKEVAALRIQVVEEWLKAENAKLDGPAQFFATHLQQWHRGLVADPSDEAAWAKEKNKTVPLPDGELVARAGSYSTEIEDEEAFINWTKELEPEEVAEMVESKPSFKKAGIVKHIKATGEVPAGVKYERGEASFTVKPKVGE